MTLKHGSIPVAAETPISPPQDPAPQITTQSSTLASGLTITTSPMPHHKSVAVGVVVGCGSRYETVANNGISHLLEHTLYRGSEGYPTAYAFNAAIEACTIGLDGATTSEAMEFSTTCLEADLERTLSLLGAFLTRPTFADFAIERDVVFEELQDDLDASGRDVNVANMSRHAMFGPSGLGLPVGGDPRVVRTLDVEACRAWLRKHFVGGNMAVVVVGPVDHAAVVSAAARCFANVPTGPRLPSAPSPVLPETLPSLNYLSNRTRQADLELVWVLPNPQHPDWDALFMAYRILDGGSASRLPHRAIDQEALAYDLGAEIQVFDQFTLLSVDAAVSPGKCLRLLDTIFEVIESLSSQPPTDDEMQRQRRRAQLALARATESPEHLAGWLLQDWLQPNLPPAVERLARLATISATEVTEAAARHLRVSSVRASIVGDLPALAKAGVRRRLHRLRPRS